MEDFHCDIFLDTNFLTDPNKGQASNCDELLSSENKCYRIVGFKHIANGTFVTIDTDGLGLKDTAHNFAFVKGVSEISLSNPNNFVF